MFNKINRPRENKRRVTPEQSREKGTLSRRNFMKFAAVLGASWGVGNFTLDYLDKDENDKEEVESEEIDEELSTEGQLEIARDDETIIGSTIEEQLRKGEKVTLNVETKKAIRQKWKQSYAKRPDNCPVEDKLTGKNHLGLLQSMEKMQPWIEEMKMEFTKLGIPEKFAYLAIPESHFDMNANSRANAKGPFQFTKGTAKLFNLTVGGVIDQRCDPIESARACAEHLKYSHDRFNGDWDLAFADYNGGFTNAYAKFRPKKKERNYEDYLAWREGRINKFISKDHFEHKVKKSDRNLTKIANRYDMQTSELAEFNGIDENAIRIGQVIKIPATVDVKMEKLKDSLENLNYPEKFYAVLDVVEEEGLGKRFPSLPLESREFKIPDAETIAYSYTIQGGDGLLMISRLISSKYKSDHEDFALSASEIQKLIQEQNGIKNPRDIKPGQEITIDLPITKRETLEQIARRNEMNIEDLKAINPAIIDTKAALPAGVKVRLLR